MLFSRRAVIPGLVGMAAVPAAAQADRRATIDAAVSGVLPRLPADNLTRVLQDQARAIVLFPRVTQGGLLLGFQSGDGAMIEAGRTTGYYRLTGISLGTLIGLQHFSLAVFLMDERALAFFRNNDGWDLGLEARMIGGKTGLTDVISLSGTAGTTYAITFDETGAFLSLSFETSHIRRLRDD